MKKYYTITQYAKLKKLSYNTVYYSIKKGIIKAKNIDGHMNVCVDSSEHKETSYFQNVYKLNLIATVVDIVKLIESIK